MPCPPDTLYECRLFWQQHFCKHGRFGSYTQTDTQSGGSSQSGRAESCHHLPMCMREPTDRVEVDEFVRNPCSRR